MNPSSLSPIEARVNALFDASLSAKQTILPTLVAPVAQAIQAMVRSIQRGGKIMACGNGGSAADAQHFSAELLNRFERERAPLPAIALSTDTSTITSIANDYDYALVFSKQVQALAKPEDCLLAISTSGQSENVWRAMQMMHDKGGTIIALTGKDGGKMGQWLQTHSIAQPTTSPQTASRHVHINASASQTARIQEMHIMVLHALCDGIDAIHANPLDH